MDAAAADDGYDDTLLMSPGPYPMHSIGGLLEAS